MGLRRGKRGRMESLRKIPDEALASIGATNIEFEKYDEQLIWDNVNKRLDIQQEKIDNK
mgnify:CR=1 FL=1